MVCKVRQLSGKQAWIAAKVIIQSFRQAVKWISLGCGYSEPGMMVSLKTALRDWKIGCPGVQSQNL